MRLGHFCPPRQLPVREHRGGLSTRFLLPAGPVTILAGVTVAIICAAFV